MPNLVLNLRVVPPILSEPFTLVYKAGKVSVRYLGVLQMIRQLYTDLPTSRASNPQPFTVSVVRTNLDSVSSLANTLKNWRSQGVTIPFFNSDSVVCVHEHFETK